MWSDDPFFPGLTAGDFFPMTDELLATLTLEQLAKVFHVSPKTMHQIRSKHPDRLPPSLEYGGRRVLFLKKDVEEWLEKRRQTA